MCKGPEEEGLCGWSDVSKEVSRREMGSDGSGCHRIVQGLEATGRVRISF